MLHMKHLMSYSPSTTSNNTAGYRSKYISHFTNFLSLPQKPKSLKLHSHKVTSACGANLGPVGHCHLTFRLGNKSFMDKFIVLKDLQQNLILRCKWQANYKIGCNWNVNGHQYITHNNKYLHTSTSSAESKPIICIAGALYLQPRSISLIMVQTPVELDTEDIYTLNASDNLPSGIFPLAVDFKNDHKYPK